MSNVMSTNNIGLYFHCKTCRSGKLAVGWTEKGLQVWCEHCDKNVLNLDFLGQKIRQADDSAPLPDWLVPTATEQTTESVMRYTAQEIGKQIEKEYAKDQPGYENATHDDYKSGFNSGVKAANYQWLNAINKAVREYGAKKK